MLTWQSSAKRPTSRCPAWCPAARRFFRDQRKRTLQHKNCGFASRTGDPLEPIVVAVLWSSRDCCWTLGGRLDKADVVNGKQNNSLDQALQQASLALRMQQFYRAEQLATDILKSNRTDRSAVLILAHALIAQNRQGEAIVPLERAVRRSNDAEIETLLGAALAVHGAQRTGSRNCGAPPRGVHRTCLPFGNSQASLPKPDNLTKLSGPSKMALRWPPRTST